MAVPSLSELRQQIDRCNRQLLALLSERAQLALQVRDLKGLQVDDLYDPARHCQMLQALVAANPGPLAPDAVATVFRTLFEQILDLMEQQQRRRLNVFRTAGEPDRVFDIAGQRLGAAPVFIAGPCSVESEAQLEAVAEILQAEGVGFLRAGAFKPRTSPYAFQGMGAAGLQILQAVARRHGLATVSEVTDPRQVDLHVRYTDVLQVGARNMYNYDLLRVLGQVDRPVLLKRHFSATLDEWLSAAEYLLAGGNERVILCERGIRTFNRETRATLDLSAVALLRQMTALPVVVDVSHAAGRTDILAPLTRAALAVGACGVMLEVHPDPPAARSDSQQQLTPEAFVRLKRSLATMHAGD